MKKICYVNVILALLLTVSVSVWAQEGDTGYNPHSIRNIHDSDIMYRREILRRMDGKEKQNQPYYASNNEITKIIIEAVKRAELRPYKNDSLTSKMDISEFLENLKMPGMDEPTEDAPVEEDNGWGATDPNKGAAGAAAEPKEKIVVSNEFLPRDVSVLELREDLIFDKKRSRMYNDILAVTLIVPGEKVATGLDRILGTFAYKDLLELFRSRPKEAIWYHPTNSREHKNYADAFELRLFKARIIKVSNPQDNRIQDIYTDPKTALLASEWVEHQLMEYEHNLWEY